MIFLSDNGYAFGAHRWQVKRCEYEECHHVPMRVYWPGVAPRTETRLVSNVDLASTIADIGDATPLVAQDGQSLVPMITGQAVTGWRTGLLEHWPGGDDVGQRPVNDSVPAYYGIRAARYHYVELGTGEVELYDLKTDPYELVNVAATRRTRRCAATCGPACRPSSRADASGQTSAKPGRYSSGSRGTAPRPRAGRARPIPPSQVRWMSRYDGGRLSLHRDRVRRARAGC